MPHQSETDNRPNVEKMTLTEFYDVFPTVAVFVEEIADTQADSSVFIPDKGWKPPAQVIEIMLAQALEDPDFEKRMHRAQDIARRAANRGALTEAFQALEEAGLSPGKIEVMRAETQESNHPAGNWHAVLDWALHANDVPLNTIIAALEHRNKVLQRLQEQD